MKQLSRQRPLSYLNFNIAGIIFKRFKKKYHFAQSDTHMGDNINILPLDEGVRVD